MNLWVNSQIIGSILIHSMGRTSPPNKKNEVRRAVLLCLDFPLTSFWSLEGFFMCGRKPIPFYRLLRQTFAYIVSWTNEDSLLKKILTCAWYSFTLNPDAKYLQNRSVIPYNRKGVTAFAVFLLSFFVSRQDKPASGIRCRSPPFNLDFYISKNSDWR